MYIGLVWICWVGFILPPGSIKKCSLESRLLDQETELFQSGSMVLPFVSWQSAEHWFHVHRFLSAALRWWFIIRIQKAQVGGHLFASPIAAARAARRGGVLCWVGGDGARWWHVRSLKMAHSDQATGDGLVDGHALHNLKGEQGIFWGPKASQKLLGPILSLLATGCSLTVWVSFCLFFGSEARLWQALCS